MINSSSTLPRDKLITVLRNWDATIVFTKVDGTERTMKCTLREDVIGEGDMQPADSGDVIHVWDIEKDAWRSIRFSSIKTAQVTN